MSSEAFLPVRRTPKRRVVFVADPGRESSGALQWALSHALLEQDDLFLVHIEQPNCRRSSGSSLSTFLKRPSQNSTDDTGNNINGCGLDFLDTMKSKCAEAQPKVRVQVERVVEMMVEQSNNSKATTILSHAKALRADLIVIGQPRRTTFLGGKLSGTSCKGSDTAEYLIENSRCLCVGVQKKGQNAGYLLNTKTHKNFWLLA